MSFLHHTLIVKPIQVATMSLQITQIAVYLELFNKAVQYKYVLKKYLFLCLMDKISYDDFMNLQKCHNELIPDRAIYCSYYSLTNT